jgi:hypothetical protein
MGLLNRLKKVFSFKHEEVESEETEFHDPHEERLTEAFVQRQQSVIDDAMDELESNVEKVKGEPTPTAAPAYDAGDVELSDLLSADEQLQDYSELNTVEHDSVEEMGDHLESATLVGDLPEEIEF